MGGYYFLAASLPKLEFGSPPPMEIKQFLELCQEQISETDYSLLVAGQTTVQQKFGHWDTCLRNCLAQRRARERNLSAPEKHSEADFWSYPAVLTQEVFLLEDPLERERRIDQARFAVIDDLGSSSWCDVNFLGAYLLKLEILTKQSMFDAERGAVNIDRLVAAVTAGAKTGETL